MRALTALAIVIAAAFPVLADAGTCQNGYMAEGQAPPAIEGINTGDTGFRSYYWAWGTNPSDQGAGVAGLTNDSSGLAVNPGFIWANSDNCSGTIDSVALLVEAQTVAIGGKFAVVAIQGAEAHLDFLQAGSLQSVAETIPVPSISSMTSGSDGHGDYVDVTLSWSTLSTAWALSDVPSVLAGFALHYVAASSGGPVNDGDRTLFSQVTATAGDTVPYITNDTDDGDSADGLLPATQTSCDVRIRSGEVYFFALSLILDGSGAGGGDPHADASAVETTYVSACSSGADGSPIIFSDGFESGGMTAWSDTVGG